MRAARFTSSFLSALLSSSWNFLREVSRPMRGMFLSWRLPWSLLSTADPPPPGLRSSTWVWLKEPTGVSRYAAPRRLNVAVRACDGPSVAERPRCTCEAGG